MALSMLIATVAVATTFTASAEEETEVAPSYVQTFTKDNFLGVYEYSEGKPNTDANKSPEYTTDTEKVVFNEDGSFTMDTDSYKNVGMRAVFSVDENMKNCIAEAQQIAEEKYQKKVEEAKKKAEDAGKEFDPESVAAVTPALNVKYRIEKSIEKKGKNYFMRDTFVYYGYILEDGTNVPAVKGGGNMYREQVASYPLSYKTFDASGDNLSSDEATLIENFDNIKAIYVELYHWTKYDKAITFSGLSLSDTPVIPEFETPDTGDDTSAVAVDWDPNYIQSYSGTPYKVLYSADNGVTEDYGKKNIGWLRYENNSCSNQWQTYFFFDRDAFNYALTVANKDGGTKKMIITITLESCVDQHGKDVQAEVVVMGNFYNGGYKELVSAWQSPGTSVDYVIDTSDWTLNCIAGIKTAVQNYWCYDKDGNMVEYMERKEGDSDTDANGSSVNYGTGVEKIYINPTATFSPITVLQAGVEPTSRVLSTEAPTETTTSSGEIEGVGYHFFDFTEDCRNLGYGNAPQTLEYVTDEESKFNGGFRITSPTKINKQHQACWTLYDAKATNDNGEEILTTIPEEVTKRIYNQMKQALAYAKAPGAPNQLAMDVKVDSAINPADNKVCSVQMAIQLMCFDDLDNIMVAQYVNVGKTATLYIDVTDLDVDMIRQVHPMAQNYANVNQKTGNASGVTNIDVTFGAIYVAGKGVQKTTIATEKADNSEAEAIYALYKQLPGTSLSDYTTAESYALLEKFIDAYWAISDATRELLESEYGLTMDDYGVLLEIYNELGFYDDSVDTGATAAPIAALFLAAAAGFVCYKSKKK